MKFATYAVASGIACIAVVTHAYLKFHQLYLTCVHIVQSGVGLLVLYNAGLMMTMLLAKTVQKLAFGNLRSIELEHVYERSWYAVTETCLAMTIFRDEFNLTFVASFFSLIIFKVYHWIVQDRIDYVEQTPSMSRFFHLRLSLVMIVLAIVDSSCVYFYVWHVLTSGPSMMVFFGFEYLVLVTMIYSLLVKYSFNRLEQLSESSWEDKSTYVFYLELVTDFCRLVIYMAFFSTVLFYYGLPLHIVRDLYLTFRSLTLRVRDLVQYRRATANMQERYPNATEEELIAIDRTCIICREDMTNGKKLPCGHIFHFQCLRSWLERQQICPTCRTSVLQPRRREQPSASVSAGAPINQGSRNTATNINSTEAEARMAPNQQEIPASHGPPSSAGYYAVWVPANQAFPTGRETSFTQIDPSQIVSPQSRRSAVGLAEETLKRIEGEQRSQLEKRLKSLVSLQDHVNDLIVQTTQYLDLTSNRDAFFYGAPTDSSRSDSLTEIKNTEQPADTSNPNQEDKKEV